jgi:hypothetical protein
MQVCVILRSKADQRSGGVGEVRGYKGNAPKVSQRWKWKQGQMNSTKPASGVVALDEIAGVGVYLILQFFAHGYGALVSPYQAIVCDALDTLVTPAMTKCG